MTTRHKHLPGLLALTVWLGMAAPAVAFECPAPQALTRPGVLKENGAALANLTATLASANDGNDTRVVIDDLRRRYPGVENAELSNYLVTAYCPVVARLTGLDGAEKQARIDNFARRTRQMIYADRQAQPASSKTP
jgi:hypothetical protein